MVLGGDVACTGGEADPRALDVDAVLGEIDVERERRLPVLRVRHAVLQHRPLGAGDPVVVRHLEDAEAGAADAADADSPRKYLGAASNDRGRSIELIRGQFGND